LGGGILGEEISFFFSIPDQEPGTVGGLRKMGEGGRKRMQKLKYRYFN
jgi:hypothetical protein